MHGAHVLCAVCGGKGGAGKTFLAANLALFLARQGHKTAIYDADVKGPSLHTALGIKELAVPGAMAFPPGATKAPSGLRATTFDNLSLIARPPRINEDGGATRFAPLGDIKSDSFDFLIVDLEAGLCAELGDLLFSGGKCAIVITPEPSALERCYMMIRQAVYHGIKKLAEKPEYKAIVDRTLAGDDSGNLIRATQRALKQIEIQDRRHAMEMRRRLKAFSVGVILNMSRSREDLLVGRMFCDTVASFYGPKVEFLGHVPYDERVLLAERKGVPFLQEYGSSETAACLEMVGRNLTQNLAVGLCNPTWWDDVFLLDHYNLLKVPRGASPESIHAAYISAISQYSEGSRATHGAIGLEERKKMIAKIERAYHTLSDPEKRTEYSPSQGSGVMDEGGDHSGVAPVALSTSGAFSPNMISGANLRDIRLSKGLSLEQLAQNTKIRKAYLSALENEEMGIFTAPVFMKGFLKCYAQALGLNPAEVLEKYMVEWDSGQ